LGIIGQEILPSVLYGANKMNMISTGAFLNGVDASDKQGALVKKTSCGLGKEEFKNCKGGWRFFDGSVACGLR
jgi:hypothetical protein